LAVEKTVVGKRIEIIDGARFYGIALVFYGHFIEELMLLKNPLAASQYKFIYSFHMVLFIVIAGYVAKDLAAKMNLAGFISNRFQSRLLPYLFFTVVMMVPPIFFPGKFFNLDLPSFQGYMSGLVATLFGLPLFCVPSWFLLLIIGVELVHFIFFRFIRDSNTKILAAALIFYIVGYLLNLKLDIFNPLKGRTVGWNYFFIHEAITLYGFYLIGVFMRRRGCFSNRRPVTVSLPVALILFGAVLLTYNLNNGPFNFTVYDAVVIIFASHGHIILFPLTALAGSLMVLFIANTTGVPRLIGYLGQNTLILMCLNGIFYHYINPPLAKWVLTVSGGSAALITAAGVLITSLSLLLCLPVVYALNRYAPRLVGKKKYGHG
jgi:acyltransferase